MQLLTDITIDEFQSDAGMYVGQALTNEKKIRIQDPAHGTAAVLLSADEYSKLLATQPRKKNVGVMDSSFFERIQNRRRDVTQEKIEGDIEQAVREVRATKK